MAFRLNLLCSRPRLLCLRELVMVKFLEYLSTSDSHSFAAPSEPVDYPYYQKAAVLLEIVFFIEP